MQGAQQEKGCINGKIPPFKSSTLDCLDGKLYTDIYLLPHIEENKKTILSDLKKLGTDRYQHRASYRQHQCCFSSLLRAALTLPSEPAEAELALGSALCWEGSARQS